MNMHVTISGLLPEAFLRIKEDLDPSHWLKEYHIDEDGLYTVELEDYVILKKNSDKLWLDCGAHLSDLNQDEFVEVKII